MIITMNQLYVSILLFLLPQLNSVHGSSKTSLDKGCIVKEKLVFDFREDLSHNALFFIGSKEQITIQVSFIDLNKAHNNVLLILKHDSGKIQSKRHGETTLDNIILNKNITLGWNDMNITVQDSRLDIGTFYTLDELEDKINDITITAKYVTACEQRTPIWEIYESMEFSIPLNELSTFEIRLTSDQPFQPDFILNEISIPLCFDKELFVKKSINPLPENDYRILVVKHNEMISIATISMHDDYKLLMSIKTNEDHSDLKVKTLSGNFWLILDPFQEDKVKVETTISKSELETPNASPIMECGVKCSAPSNIVWQICTALLAAIAAGSLFVNHYQYSRNKKGNDQEFDMEEGEHLLENLPNVSAKDKIKSEKTEPHGEFNPVFGYQKEICVLKLESDKNCSFKKTLGKLDDTKQTKVILAVGETGSGKSSVINAMANCIYGIKYEDPFRFKLIDDMDTSRIPGINTTEKITSYYIPYTPGIANDSNYILIDTPGFGDLRGIDEDTKLVTKFYEFLKKNPDITEVDAICFVIKASDTRLTEIQNYIISGLFSMFGKDVIRNIYVVVSFSDGSLTHVPKLLKDSGLDFDSEIMHFDGKGLFNDSKEFEGLSDEDIQEDFREKWNITMTYIDNFFKALKKKTPVSLILTNMVLEENKDITILMDELSQLIEKEELTTEEDKLNIQAKIEQNQSLIMMKLNEAKKLTGRLKNIPCKENPLAINDYIDLLITRENDENKIEELKKLKNRNTIFQNLLREKESNSFNIIKYFFGQKNEKMD